jgi:diguanylate cyclase (GGDEF)-like protein/PAS domain S-box-containing protein
MNTTGDRTVSELRMRALIQAIPDLVWLKDTEGVYLLCNSRFEDLFGTPESAIVGKTDYDFVDKDQADFFRRNDQAAMDSGGPSRNEEWLTFASDGHHELTETTKTPVRDSMGKVIGVLGIGHNITERRRNELALTESEARFRTVFELSQDAIVLHRNGKLLYINPATVQMFGAKNAQELLDKPILELIHPDYHKIVMDRVKAANEQGIAGPRIDEKYIKLDGTVIDVEAQGQPISLAGQPTVLVTLRDITERKHTEEALKRSEAYTRTILDSIFDQIAVIDQNGVITAVNAVWSRFALENSPHPGTPADHTDVGTNYLAVCRASAASDSNSAESAAQGIQAVLDGRVTTFSLEFPCHSPEQKRWFRMRVTPLSSQGDGAVIAHTIITEQVLAKEALLESEQKFRLIAENTSDGITIFDKNRTIQYVSPSVTKQLGYSEQEELGRSSDDVYAMLHPQGRDALFQNLDEAIQNRTPALTYSYQVKHKDGHYIWREDSTNLRYTSTGEYDGAYVVSRDITERKRMEEEVRQLAYFDALTQLPNRRMLSDRLGQSIAASKRSGLHAAVMVLDLDNFKPLNDQYGHLAGDLLLVEVARRLIACVREVDTVARFGGDEFVVVLNDLDEDKAKSRGRAQAVAEKIRLALEEPYVLSFKNDNSLSPNTIEHHCSASIGVALFLSHETDQSELLKWADAAMYQAKEAGRNTIRFHRPSA